MEENDILILNTIDEYNKAYGLPTRHPLLSVFNLRDAKVICNHITVNYGVYALFLKNDASCSLKYGREYYDYQEGTVVSFAPGQVVRVDLEDPDASRGVYGILFHPDLIHGTSLGEHIGSYTFFQYSEKEALHLSEGERKIFVDTLERISKELEYPVDKHSRQLLSSSIELLLEYCLRFYDRQFITRGKVNDGVLETFEKALGEYFESDSPLTLGIPSVSYFASKVFLSPGYFGDLVKKETGKTAQEYIQDKIISLSKHRLLRDNESISAIAYDLGFQYPQHFTRLFKSKTGMSPQKFRQLSTDN